MANFMQLISSITAAIVAFFKTRNAQKEETESKTEEVKQTSAAVVDSYQRMDEVTPPSAGTPDGLQQNLLKRLGDHSA